MYIYKYKEYIIIYDQFKWLLKLFMFKLNSHLNGIFSIH